MDPNNTQQNTQPIQQPPIQQGVNEQITPQQPINQPEVQTPSPSMTVPPQGTPMNGGKKKLILLIILFILITGMVVYVLFANNRLKIAQQNTANNSTASSIPTHSPAAISPTPATVEEIEVASPDADLNAIEKDVQGL